MNNLYPASPTDVPKNITRASKTYKRHAWLAMLLLLTFVIIYLSMTAWFAWTAYDLIVNAFAAQYLLLNIVGGACSALLSVFMLKAFLFFERSNEINDMEVTQEKEPALFEFLHQLADEAGAPRPHRVFLSSRVNAAVFYDLTILNLFFPSKKNLEIGLPLINCLNLGELKAVLAHEFGHFAQKSMAVGRWVYVAQQIAAHIISKRDAFDSFLIGLSRTDIRIAWLGWLLRITVWSIRSAMETLFSFVIMSQRALSREMEFQADRVAVSLTGSDALIHALHKLEAADDSWGRALNFMQSELGNKRAVNNLFLVQQRVIEHLRKILDDADYGKEPTLPTKNPEQFRVFKLKLAQPPKMWATHPENTAREENAKEIYIQANIDSRSGWDLFNNAKQLQETATADTIEKYTPKDSSLTTEDCISHLDAMYNKNIFNPKYRGVYLGRSAVRNYASVHDMYVDNGMPKLHDFDNLYTKETADHIEQLNNLNEERFHLSSIQNGSMKAHGGIARFRGKELQKKDISSAIDEIDEEIKALQLQINISDQQCRSIHLQCARTMGQSWESYLLSLATAVHYAQHTQDDLYDAKGYLLNVWHVIWADGNVSKGELKRLLKTCNEVHQDLRIVYRDAKGIKLNAELTNALETDSWENLLGEFTLPPANQDNINDWMKVIENWIDSTAYHLGSLRSIALEQLLETEEILAQAYINKKTLDQKISSASVFPKEYKILLPGQERQRQTKLDWWDSFQTAAGIFPAIMRTTIALTIVGAVLGGGWFLGNHGKVSEVIVYNGLSIPITVLGEESTVTVPPKDHASLDLPTKQVVEIQTYTDNGQLIEKFSAEAGGHRWHTIYNAASAASLVKWHAVYGNRQAPEDKVLGNQRWLVTRADYVFEEPPESINTKQSGGVRSALAAYSDNSPSDLLSTIDDADLREEMIIAHTKWDDLNSTSLMLWFDLIDNKKTLATIVEQRLKNDPDSILLLRYEQIINQNDNADVCAKHRKMYQRNINNTGLYYLSIRCITDKREKNAAYIQASTQFPDAPWLANAAGLTYLEQQQFSKAAAKFDAAFKHSTVLKPIVAAHAARLQKATNPSAKLDEYARYVPYLRHLSTIESAGIDSPYYPYVLISQGKLTDSHQSISTSDEEEAARTLRLLAASKGATQKMIDQALTLPVTKGLDYSTIWPAIGLAIKNNRDWEELINQAQTKYGEAVFTELPAFIKFLLNEDYSSANSLLKNMQPDTVGYYYVLASVLKPKSVPSSWTTLANGLLFATEKPYL